MSSCSSQVERHRWVFYVPPQVSFGGSMSPQKPPSGVLQHLLLQLKPDRLCPVLPDAPSAGRAGAAPGADGQGCAGDHQAPSKPQTGNILMFFSFCSSRVTSQTFLPCPLTVIIKVFPSPKVISRHGYWIFLHVPYFPLPLFFIKQARTLSSFPSPLSSILSPT